MSEIGSKTHKQVVEDVREMLETRMRIAVRYAHTDLGDFSDVINIGLMCDALTRTIPGLNYTWTTAQRIAKEQVEQSNRVMSGIEEREVA